MVQIVDLPAAVSVAEDDLIPLYQDGVLKRISKAILVNPVTDGDKGDITVSNEGTIWTIDSIDADRVGSGNVSNTEFEYLDGVTSNIQYQFDNFDIQDTNFLKMNFTTGIENPAYNEGTLFYDDTKKALSYYNEEEDVIVNLGRELLFRVINKTGSTITNGTVVYPSGVDATSGLPTVGIADASQKEKCRLVAMVTHDIENDTIGYVTRLGSVSGLNTDGLSGVVYLTTDGTGGYTMNKPTDGGYVIALGGVTKQDATDGIITMDVSISELTVEVTDTNGFPTEQRDVTTISFDDVTRTFSIAPTGDEFHYYQTGDKYEKTSTQSKIITDVEGQHVLYFDGDTLTSVVNPTESELEEIFRTKVSVSIVYWDATNSEHVYLGDERHGISMSPITHAYLHATRGTQFLGGLALNSIIADDDGSSDTHAQFGNDLGSITDEDLPTEIDALASTTGMTIYYLDGANGYLRKETNAGFSILTTGTGRMAYNEWTGATWQLTEIGDGKYGLCHVFATNDTNNKLIAVVGQNEYLNVVLAREGANNEVASLITMLPLEELIPVGTLIFQTATAYTNSVNARIRSTDTGDDYVDWRVSELAKGAAPSNHENLSNLEIAGAGVPHGHINSSIALATPRLTTTERDAGSYIGGETIYNTTLTAYQIYVNGGWKTISDSTSSLFTSTDESKLDGIEAGAEVNTITSVNTLTGAVVLDPDDLDDTSTTNKFTTAGDISKLAGIEALADVTDATNVEAAGALMQGKQTLWIPANAMTPATTSGAATGTIETTTNAVCLDTLDFDTSADEYAWFNIAFPKSWNQGTITFQPFWTTTAGTSGTVAWGLGGVSLADSDVLDTALGTTVISTDTMSTAGDVHVGPESTAVTIAGSPSTDELCMFRVIRDVSADTLDNDAQLIGIKVIFTVNSSNDD